MIRDSHRRHSVKIMPVSIHAHIFVLFYSDLSKTFTTCQNGSLAYIVFDHMYLNIKCNHVSFYTWLQKHLQEGHGWEAIVLQPDHT